MSATNTSISTTSNLSVGGGLILPIVATKPEGPSGLLWLNSTDSNSLYVDATKVSDGSGGTTDTRIDTYFFNAPPPASAIATLGTSSSEVYVNWTNPTQLVVGFMNQPLPLINTITIRYRIPTLTGSWTTAYSGAYNSSTSAIIINQGSGSTLTGQTRTINGTTYTNMILFYINSSSTFDLQVYYANYAGSSTTTTITGLSFLVAGPPSVPTITTTTVTGTTTANITAQPGAYTDASNNLVYGQAGAPSLSSYTVQYTPVSAVQRYPTNTAYNTTQQTLSSAANQPASTTILNLSTLYPDTNYNLQLKATNSLGQTSAYSSPATSITTNAPSPTTSFLNSFTTPPATQYSAATVSPILYTGNASNTVASGLISIMTQAIRGSIANPVSTVAGFVVSANRASVSFAGFPAATAGAINNNSSDITFSNIVASTDQGAAATSGFFLQSGFSYTINSGLTARATPYTLDLSQNFAGDSTKYRTTIQFYVDSLPSATAPTFVSAPSLTNGSTTTSVTGVPIINGAWSLTVGASTTNDVAYWFCANPVLAYAFAGASATMLSSITVAGTRQNILAGSTITGSTGTFYYLPSITLTIKNINGLTATSVQTVNAIINSASVSLIAGMNTDSAPTGLQGRLMNSPDLSGSTSSDWTTAQTALAHNATIVGTNNLQIMNGAFVSKSYTATSASAYQNYTALAGPNYSGIGAAGYRWATFRWSASNGIPTSLAFQIRGLGGTAAPTVKNATAPYVSNLLVFYRVENPADNSGTPSNVANPANSLRYSTVWINANYLAQNFSQLYATTSNTLTFGGLPNGASDITISGSNISFNVLSPTQTGTAVYIYVSVGIPMNVNIAFTGAYCTVV
jgi:hypothetical protein